MRYPIRRETLQKYINKYGGVKWIPVSSLIGPDTNIPSFWELYKALERYWRREEWPVIFLRRGRARPYVYVYAAKILGIKRVPVVVLKRRHNIY